MRTLVKTALYRALTGLRGNDRNMVVLPVLRGPAQGLKFELDLVQREEGSYFWGKYDREILSRLQELVKPGWCVWDCGTYLGFYTCVFARLVGSSGRVIAIEPDPFNLERTMRCASLNGLTNVVPHHVAVGLPAGEIELVVSQNSNSHLPGYYVGSHDDSARWSELDRVLPRIRVRSVSLDEALLSDGLPTPNLIKLDIEGAEVDALDHMQHLVDHVKPIVLLELHNPDCDEAARRFAARTGYRLLTAETARPIESREQVQGTLICVPPGSALGHA